MAKKLSKAKINKIMEYKNTGFSQHYTAAKLHINQSTVCHYWNKFDVCAKVEGLEAATEKYGGGDAAEINTFAAEMKKENLSLPDAKAGFKMVQLFEKLGVWPEGYESAIKACLKINNEEGFLDTAAELVELEEKLGSSGLDVISDLEDTENKLQGAKDELDKLYQLIESTKEELDGLKKKRQAATKEFEQHMKYLGLTLHRFELVKNLSLALKKADIPDESVETYLKRQAILDEAKLNMALFTAVVTQAKIVTAPDGGQALLSALKEYGSLTAVNASLGVKQKTLKESIVGLQQQAELKGKLEGEVAVLAAEKAALEPYLEKLQASKEAYDKLQLKIAESLDTSSKLVQQLTQRKQEKDDLEKCVDELSKKAEDLIPKGKQLIQLNQQLAELEAEKKKREDEWQSFLGFVALIQEQPLKGLELFSEVLPLLIENVKKGEYKAITVRNHTVKMLTGHAQELPMCHTCVNKSIKIEPPKLKNVQVVPYSIEVIEGTGPS